MARKTDRVEWWGPQRLNTRISRFALGLPVNGRWQTDATWFTWGKKTTWTVPPRGLFGLRLGHRPGYQRMVIRWVGTALTTYEAAGWLVAPVETAINTAVGVTAISGAVGYRAYRDRGEAEVAPAQNALQLQLAKLLDTPHADVSASRDGTVTLELPVDFILDEGNAKRLIDLVQRTMGRELDVSWPNLLKERTVVFSRIPEPPALVRYDAIREKMLALPDGTVFLGIDNREQDLIHSLDGDAPHIALSMPTGRGKSTTFRLLLGQLIEQGAGITILDAKRISLNEFRKHPSVRLVRDIQQCWDEIELFSQEIGERYRALEDLDPEDFDAVMATWRRRVLFFEELNAFRGLSQKLWDQVRTSKDRATPPCFATIAEILFMARQVKMHVVVASQRFEARTIGGGANREQFGLRLLSNPTKADWSMFGQGTKPRGSFARAAGRSVAVFAGQARAVQLGYMTLAEVRAHMATPRSCLGDVVAPIPTTPQEESQGVSYDSAVMSDSLVTLRDWCEGNGESLIAVRAAVQRALLPSFGTGRGGAKLYEPHALAALRSASSYDPSVVVEDVD